MIDVTMEVNMRDLLRRLRPPQWDREHKAHGKYSGAIPGRIQVDFSGARYVVWYPIPAGKMPIENTYTTTNSQGKSGGTSQTTRLDSCWTRSTPRITGTSTDPDHVKGEIAHVDDGAEARVDIKLTWDLHRKGRSPRRVPEVAVGKPPHPTSGWPPPYSQLSKPPPEDCRPFLALDWREFERCLLLSVELRADRLPNLLEGTLETWGRSNPTYNCFAFAANPYDREKAWVGGREGGLVHPGDVTGVKNFDDLKNHLEGKGWREMPWRDMKDIVDRNIAPGGGEERIVIYRDRNGKPEHAALWDQRGILAKMGEYGVFRFSSLDQMVGPAYGRPANMFRNAGPSTR